LSGTNTLPYLASSSATKEKSFITSTPGCYREQGTQGAVQTVGRQKRSTRKGRQIFDRQDETSKSVGGVAKTSKVDSVEHLRRQKNGRRSAKTVCDVGHFRVENFVQILSETIYRLSNIFQTCPTR